MARKRFVTSEISTDRKIAKLAEKNPTAAALWPWFITGFDDWGRMEADPVEVKLTIFPAFPYTSDDIETFIKLYHEFGIAYHYEVDGKPYLAVNPETWLKYQTYIRKDKLEKQNSKIPEPKNAPWAAKNNTVDDLGTKNVAKQQSATINALSPSPSPSPSPSEDIYSCPNPPVSDEPHEPGEVVNSDAKTVFEHWNSKDIIQHRKLTEKIKRAINGALRNYSAGEVCAAIDNYAVILKDDRYYWSYKWTLQDFLQRGIEKFLDFETAAQNYLKDKPKSRDAPTMSRNVENALRLVEKYTLEEGGYS